MYRFFTFILIGFVMLQQPAFSQNFDKLTSQLFFDANLKRPDTTLIAYFHAKQELAPVKQTGWIVYQDYNW